MKISSGRLIELTRDLHSLRNEQGKVGKYRLNRPGETVSRVMWVGRVDPGSPQGIQRSRIDLKFIVDYSRQMREKCGAQQTLFLVDPGDLILQEGSGAVKLFSKLDLIGVCSWLVQTSDDQQVPMLMLGDSGARLSKQIFVIGDARSAFQGLNRRGQPPFWPKPSKTLFLSIFKYLSASKS